MPDNPKHEPLTEGEIEEIKNGYDNRACCIYTARTGLGFCEFIDAWNEWWKESR